MIVPKAVAAACTAGVLFPFYIYPSKVTSCDQWQTMISTLNAHPSLPFTLVINPGSGPGNGTVPDAEYQKCLPTLRQTSNANVKVVGYVSTSFGSRSSSLVNADVTTYSNWPASYKPDGIWFDEVPTSSSLASLYASYVSNVKSKTWNSASKYTILNPGAAVPSAYFATGADLVVTIENYYNSFSNSQLVLNDPNEPPSKQAVILHDAPSTLPTSTINQLISTDHLNSIFITDVLQVNNPYGSYPSYWSAFVNAVGTAAGGC